MASSYDSGEVTPREQQAAKNQLELAKFNADTTRNQLSQQLANYDQADRQNRSLADVQLKQNSRQAASDRFGQNKRLQAATQGLLGSVGNALNGSSTYNLLNMLATRTDLDNADAWQTLTQNQNSVENAYQESLNQNVLSRNDAASNAEQALRGIEADTAAQLNNINPNLYTAPGTGDADLGGTGTYDANKRGDSLSQISGYIMPDNAASQARKVQSPNRKTGGSYYDMLLNSYNNGRR